MDNNLWPELDKDESTKCIYVFIETLREELKSKYDGKIKCSFEEIEYKSYSFDNLQKSLAGLKNSMEPAQEKSLIEKDKEEVLISPPKEMKFILYNDKYFFRVFDVKIGAYFPVEIRPNEGIVNRREYEYEEIDSGSEFNVRVLSYLRSKYIKDVIRYMASLK